MTMLLVKGRCSVDIHEECRGRVVCVLVGDSIVCHVGKAVLRGLSGRCGMQQELGG